MSDSNTRVRANFTTNSKGQASIDVTAEANTPEEIQELLSQAVDVVENVLTNKHIEMIHKTAKAVKLED